MCSVRWGLATDWGDLTIAAGVNSGGGARIVHRDGGGPDQRLEASGRPTPAPGDEGIFSREYTLPGLIGPMLMILIAPREREPEQEVPSDAANEQIAHNALNLDCAEGELEVRNLEEGGDQGTVPERPSAVVPERTHDNDQVSEGARHAIRSERSESEC